MTQIDVERLRERYRLERDRRVRPPDTDQFISAQGSFAHFAEDPYAGSPTPRDGVARDVDVVIIGCGFGGIEMAVTLSKAGVQDFLMLDGAGDFGGTWYWNRYPGIRCDVESYIYLPYLEEIGYIPSERYVRGSEIFEYCKLLGRHFELYGRALWQTRVASLVWDEQFARWVVTTNRGDILRARFVSTQSGIFDRPQLPGIAGIDTFQGKIFHSARWEYEYTGGDSDGGLSRLYDKRVAVIGTGATGLQIIPELAQAAEALVVVQRTPTAVGVRDNAPTDHEWFKSLPPGWQRQRMVAFNQLANGEAADCGIDDGWTRFFRRLIDAEQAIPAEQRNHTTVEHAKELADFAHNELVRARVDAHVRDGQKAQVLKAYYRTLCKRPGFSDDFLPAMDRDNVVLVDASGGVERFTADGLVVNGVEYRVDCVILATGFELGTTWSQRSGYDVVGRDQLRVSEKFAPGIRTFQGLFSVGFPNLFFTGVTQGGTTTNVPHMLQEQADHVTYLIDRALTEGWSTVEATQEAEDQWQEQIAAVNRARRAFQQACTPGYFNAEGRPDDARFNLASGSYRPSTRFFRSWQESRRQGDLTGLRIT